jgi:purine-cytosine permease-like protein
VKAAEKERWTPFQQVALSGFILTTIGFAIGTLGYIGIIGREPESPTWLLVSGIGTLTGIVTVIGCLILSKLEKLGAR